MSAESFRSGRNPGHVGQIDLNSSQIGVNGSCGLSVINVARYEISPIMKFVIVIGNSPLALKSGVSSDQTNPPA